MTEAQLLQRRIKLKRQALPLIKEEIERDQIRLALLRLKSRMEDQIANEFNSVLSSKLDAVMLLLESDL